MALTEQKIINAYSYFKQKAYKFYENNNIHKALLYAHIAAYTNNVFFISFYDVELENLLKNISYHISKNNTQVQIERDRCVFLDSLSRYRGGLTVQYVKAIAKSGWDMLYITEQEIDAPQRSELKLFLKSLDNVTVVEVPKKLKGLAKLQFMYDTIISFKPYRVYMHQNSYDSYLSTLSYSLPDTMIKYTIDIADHAFLLGYQSGNYSFEFRELGCSIAAKHRNQSINRMMLLPFYPIIDNVPFKGLPKKCIGKKLILSGGRYWKIIDKDDTFFKLICKIIDNNPDVVVLFPGSGDDSVIKEKIKQYSLEEKFFLLGWRNDMSELFRKSVLFLNTYPHGGGTMSQYAAHLRTPILSYQPQDYCINPVECFVCQDGFTKISSIGMNDFIDEANKILQDSEYAYDKAEKTYKVVLGEQKFNSYFKRMSENLENIIPFKIDENVNLSKDQRLKQIQYQNKIGEYQTRVVALTGINYITLDFDFIRPFVLKILPKIKNVLITRGFHFNRI